MLKIFKTKKIWIILLSIVLLITLSSLTNLKIFSIGIFSFPLKLLSNIDEAFRTKNSLLRENTDLKKTIAQLSIEKAQFSQFQDENVRLRDLLNFTKKNKFSAISAEIIARNPNDWIGSFIIDKGTASGLEKNAAVCSAKGLLGKIVDPGKNTSSVMLLVHPSFKIGGMINNTRISGIVVGSGVKTIKMLYLPIDSEIEEGASVVTSGFSRIFPKGIPIGEVLAVHKSKTGLYKYAIVKPFADLDKQEEVLCVVE